MARRMPTFEDLQAEYATLWASMEIRAGAMPALSSTARKIIAVRDRYQVIEAATGVPWYVIGIIHAMEAGLRFDRHLHNGDPLTRRTVQVPAGRPLKGHGPFSFEESACDALLMKRLDTVPAWTVPRIAYELERYNGWGYRLYHAEVASPYLWSGTTHYTRGKYVSDGNWSATAVSGQSGAMALLKRIAELEPSVCFDVPEQDPAAEFVRTPDVADASPASMAQSSTGNTAIALGAGGSVTTATEVSNAMAIVARSGNGFSLTQFALALAQSPTFWVGLFTVAGAAYVWLERRRKLTVYGV